MRTILTVNEPLIVPGAVLDPGRYVMRLTETHPDHLRVQILSADETRVITTTTAIPHRQLVRPSGDPAVVFFEAPIGQREALRAWFPPHEPFGFEFVFDREQAEIISTVSGRYVLYRTDEPGLVVRAFAPTGEMTLETARTTQLDPIVAPRATVLAEHQFETTAVAQQIDRAPALPATASPIPLTALIGLFSLAAAGAIRTIRNITS